MRPLIAALFLCPTAAGADFYTGNRLYEHCEKEPRLAAAYAAGIFDAVSAVEYYTSLPPAFCASDGISLR